MSSPERELPPLRVKILGDNSSFKKAHDEAIAMAKSMDEHVKKVTRGAGGVGADKETVRRIKGMNKAYANQVKQDNAAIKAKIDGENAKFNKEFQNEVLLDKQRRAKERADRQARISRLREMGSDLRQNLKNDEASMAATRRKERADRQARISRLREMGSDLRQNLKNDQAAIVSSRRREQAALRFHATNRRAALDILRTRVNALVPRPPSRAAGGSRPGFDGGIGNRADIYMHAQGIKNLVSMVSGVVKMSTAWQDMTIQLEGFTGSAKEAEATMNKIQGLALVSPYGMQTLGDATRTMMSYGMEVKQSLQVTEMLGDLSGGSAERMHRLAYAMGQIASVGHLTGMELRQLTEAGFNPLQTMAKAMATDKSVAGIAKQFALLNDMKAKGRITSDMVIAAMKVETSAGGRFAGQMQRLSQTVSGLSQQIREYVQLIGRRFMDTLIKDTEEALKVILHYVKAAEQWVTANKAAVREIALAAVQVVGAIAAFHGLGFVIALLRWNMRSLGIIAAFLRGMLVVLTPVTWAYNAVLWGWNAAILAIGFSYQLLTTYIAACNAMAAIAGGPIALIVGALVALSAGWSALIVGPFVLGAIALAAWNGAKAIWAIGENFDTAWTSMENFAGNAQGFFENFGHNSKVIAKYVVDNWKAMATDMQNILAAATAKIPHNMAVMWHTGKRLAVQFLVWMTRNMAIGFGNMFSEILKEFGTFATNAFKILLEVAKAVANPASLIGTGFNAATSMVSSIIDPLTMGRDTAEQMDDGLWAAMRMIMEEESRNLQSGMEDLALQTPGLAGLKLDKMDWSKLPKDQPPAIPPAFDPNFQAMFGPETGKGGNKGGLVDAPAYQSGAHAKQIYADTERMQARAAGTPKKEEKLDKTNKLLEAIRQNTKPGMNDGNTFLVETALGGVNQ